MDSVVVIIGAGPAGMAVAACLYMISIPFIILEKDDCVNPKRADERWKLHLAKEFCQLPYMPFPRKMPKFMLKDYFIRYLDNYASHFGLNPIYHMNVECATYDEQEKNGILRQEMLLPIRQTSTFTGSFTIKISMVLTIF
jgi:indole-3-pyruvate monooxygenase